MFMAWLIGYYYEECPVCGRYVAILNDGRFVNWCSRRKHAADALKAQEARNGI